MEICSNLYNLLKDLVDSYSNALVRFSVNRTNIVKENDPTTIEKSLFKEEKGMVINHLEEKLKMINVIGNPSLACGSPYRNMPMEVLLIREGSTAESVVCVIEEFPECCGAVIIKKFITGSRTMSVQEYGDLFTRFIHIVYELIKIMGYTTAVYIVSSRDNELLYENVSQIVEHCSSQHFTFVNKKTQALCTMITKSL